MTYYGAMTAETDGRNLALTAELYGPHANDPDGRLIDWGGLEPATIDAAAAVMAALGRLRFAERHLLEAARDALGLNETDLRAVHFLVLCENRDELATPSSIAGWLGISTASTTKLLDRLEAAGHIRREAHPSDRRALTIALSRTTKDLALEMVGRPQARRLLAAARLSPEEQAVVIAFLDDMAAELAGGAQPKSTPPKGARQD